MQPHPAQNTNRLQVARAKAQALITKDRMRVDVALLVERVGGKYLAVRNTNPLLEK
ncbi:MAG: hypothetical protein ABFS56_30555 [Pseudomonadota bacterium]